MKIQYLAVSVLLTSLGMAQAQNKPNVLTACEQTEGFELLWNGNTIESFRENFTTYKKDVTNPPDNSASIPSTYRVNSADSAIVSDKSQPDIRSKTMYKDFDWRIQYRNNANQGLFYRFLTLEAEPWHTGIELAIEDNVNIADQKTAAGAAYSMFAPNPKVYNAFSSNKWNNLRVVAIGDSVEHWLNGKRVVSFRYQSDAWYKQLSESKWKISEYPRYCVSVRGDFNSKPIAEGFIGIQGNHGGEWKLRSMRINTNVNTLKFGEDCITTGITRSTKSASKPTFTFDRDGSFISLRLPVLADRVELLALDGREISRTNVELGGSARLTGWGRPGVYFVNATSAGRSVLRDKIFLQ